MNKTKESELKIPILNHEYSVIVCWGDSKYISKVLKGWHGNSPDMASSLNDRRGVCFYKNGCHPVIALPGFPKTAAEIGTLAHEAVHAINHIFDSIEERSRDEVFAHSVGAVVRQVLSTSKA